MDDRFSVAPVVGIVALFIGVMAILIIRSIRSRKIAEQEKKENELKAEEGIAAGVLAKDPITGEVYSKCIVCGGRATTYAPISGASWMDKLPLLNRLFGLPPRYTIVDDVENAFQYCKIHKEVAVKKLEQFHAALRAERSRFNADQADKVAHMDAGGLHQIVSEQHREAIEMLERRRERVASVPMLAAPATKQVLSTMVTSQEEDEDEDGGRPRLEIVGGRGS